MSPIVLIVIAVVLIAIVVSEVNVWFSKRKMRLDEQRRFVDAQLLDALESNSRDRLHNFVIVHGDKLSNQQKRQIEVRLALMDIDRI